MPAGKSAHLELGYIIGQGKPGYILFDKMPERLDVMHVFANGVFFDVEELGQTLLKDA
jgi:nucleoside 2-deoxyribosyltransferase